jgi:hypothetical protein
MRIACIVFNAAWLLLLLLMGMLFLGNSGSAHEALRVALASGALGLPPLTGFTALLLSPSTTRQRAYAVIALAANALEVVLVLLWHSQIMSFLRFDPVLNLLFSAAAFCALLATPALTVASLARRLKASPSSPSAVPPDRRT